MAGASVQTWLRATETVSQDGRYWHLGLEEDAGQRLGVLPDLKSYVQQAHRDARRRLTALASITLDPLAQEPRRDPAFGYPWALEAVTLQGYLGEVFAGLIAESFGPFGIRTWEVPAFLFRFHEYAFDVLERWQQGGPKPRKIPGRPGDDCVAFERDGNGDIARILVCEAKCTLGHRADLIRRAHANLSDPAGKSVTILKLVDILRDRGDASAMEWIRALLQSFHSAKAPERCDMVAYLCGKKPSRQSSWIPSAAPNTAYTGGRKLEAVEVYLSDVGDLVSRVYRDKSDWDGSPS